MKITHVISDSNVGGAGILLSSLISELKNEFEFEVLLPRGSKLIERLPASSVKITEVNTCADKSFDTHDIGKLTRYFKRSAPDVVHTHASLSARVAARLAGVSKCLSTRHCAYSTEGMKRIRPMQRIIYNFFTDITVSTARCATKNLLSEGLTPEKIVTIYNGVRVDKKHDTNADDRLLKKLNIPKGSRIIGSVARLENVKGQDLIIRAASKILSDFDDIYFLIIGDGSSAEEYKSLAARLGVRDRVIFTGYVSHPEEYQRIFYLNVNASRGTETSCLAISECMGLGIPTVASDFGGNTEMIEDGKNGLLFKKDNVFDIEKKIRAVLSSAELHRRLSLGAEEIYADRYSIGKMISQYRDLYRSLNPS